MATTLKIKDEGELEVFSDERMFQLFQQAVRDITELGSEYVIVGSRTWKAEDLADLVKFMKFYERRIKRKKQNYSTRNETDFSTAKTRGDGFFENRQNEIDV